MQIGDILMVRLRYKNFTKIYEQARHLNNIEHTSDLVVRLKKDGNWVIESRIESRLEETVLEVTLEDFWSYWYHCYDDMRINVGYVPTKECVSDYVKYVEDIREMGLC
jgi:hypothetical protein